MQSTILIIKIKININVYGVCAGKINVKGRVRLYEELLFVSIHRSSKLIQ